MYTSKEDIKIKEQRMTVTTVIWDFNLGTSTFAQTTNISPSICILTYTVWISQ